MNNDNAHFLWNLMPEWVRKDEPGLDPTMYGTGTYEGDLEVQKKVREILNKGEENG